MSDESTSMPTALKDASPSPRDTDNVDQEPRHHPAGRQIKVIAVVAIAVLGVALMVGLIPRLQRNRELNAAAADVASARPRVTVAIARDEKVASQRVLPGNALPLLEASLIARTTGYVKSRLVD